MQLVQQVWLPSSTDYGYVSLISLIVFGLDETLLSCSLLIE